MGPPHRKWQILAVVGILVLVVVVCLTVPGGGEDRKPPPPPPKPAAESSQPPAGMSALGDLPLTFVEGVAKAGDPLAKVKVEAFIPGHGGCGNETAKVLCDLVAANPGKIRLIVADFEDGGGRAYQEQTGTSCAGLLINGRQEIEVPNSKDGKVTVRFKDNMGDLYTREDLCAVLDQEFQRAYGEKLNTEPPKVDEEASSDAAAGGEDQKTEGASGASPSGPEDA